MVLCRELVERDMAGMLFHHSRFDDSMRSALLRDRAVARVRTCRLRSASVRRRSAVVGTYSPWPRSLSTFFAHSTASVLRLNVRVRGSSPLIRTLHAVSVATLLNCCHCWTLLVVLSQDCPTNGEAMSSGYRNTLFLLVPGGEVESPRYHYRRILSPLRLPVPPSRLWVRDALLRRVARRT